MKPPYTRPELRVIRCRDYAPLTVRRRRWRDDLAEVDWRDLIGNFVTVVVIFVCLWLALVWGAAMGFSA